MVNFFLIKIIKEILTKTNKHLINKILIIIIQNLYKVKNTKMTSKKINKYFKSKIITQIKTNNKITFKIIALNKEIQDFL